MQQAPPSGSLPFSHRMSQPQTVVLNRSGSAATSAAAAGQIVNRGPGGGGLIGGGPILVNTTSMTSQPQILRVQGPGQAAHHLMTRAATVPTAITQGRNIVINQPGIRPGAPGSQITVPLTTLQGLQPGQGIPTGQAGHLLVKTDTGQYQILKVGQSTAAAAVTNVSTSSLPTQPVSLSQSVPLRAPIVTAPGAVTPAMTQRGAVLASPQSPAAAAASSGPPRPASSGGMGQQMTPDTAKLKCKNFLATLLRLASEQPPVVAANVRGLIQGLIDGKVEPEAFTTRLQKELNSSPQPCLVPFLKKSLPYLQHSLRTGELTIEGVRTPVMNSSVQPPSHLGAAVRVPRPVGAQAIPQRQQMHLQQRPGLSPMTMANAASSPGVMRATVASATVLPGLPSSISSRSSPSTLTQPTVQRGVNSKSMVPAPKIVPVSQSLPLPTPAVLSASPQAKKEKSSSSSFSTAGDEDINDVAAMGGVNLAEESQRMQGSTELIGTQIRSCKDETFLQTGLLHRRVAHICRDQGLDEPPPEVVALVSHATQDRLKTLLEKLSVVAEHRMDVLRWEPTADNYEVVQDVKGQLRFLADLDRLERRRHEEAERELLLRAAKSRTKTEDPEKEKLKAKAKELQRIEEEQLRHEKANNTALLAIGGPKKKLKLDEQMMNASVTASGASSVSMRPRTKRVHMRDLMFVMENEKELKRSPLLWKAYVN